MIHRRVGLLAAMLVVTILILQVRDVQAYDAYRKFFDFASCSNCHNGFINRGPLHDLHVGNQEMTNTCGLCHTNTGDIPLTYSSGEVGGEGCRGCHGRDDGGEFSWGAGLRAHHAAAGAPADFNGQFCADCHTDDPVMVVGEEVLPVYYSRADVNVNDPCDGSEDYDGDGKGLDNDGDLDYDADDTDCQTTGIDPTLVSTYLRISPNPFTSTGTTLHLAHGTARTVELIVYDLAGRRVFETGVATTPGTEQLVPFPATDQAGVPIASGVYLVEMRTGSGSLTRPMVLIR